MGTNLSKIELEAKLRELIKEEVNKYQVKTGRFVDKVEVNFATLLSLDTGDRKASFIANCKVTDFKAE